MKLAGRRHLSWSGATSPRIMGFRRSTVIDYSEQHQIELEYLNGRSEKLHYSCFRDLQKGLEHYTTDSSVARQLRAVNVFLPAGILKNEFRIIDTPGTNVTEAWHEDVTVRALKEKSDLSIILTSAEKPVPGTMLSFLRKNLESILPQCVFVVTKLDMIRPRERKQQLAYVKMKLEEELEIQETVVLPYVSPMVLGSGISNDMPAETKRRICIIGGFGVGKKSMVEVLLKGKLPDCFMWGPDVADIFAAPDSPVCYISTDSGMIGISGLLDQLSGNGSQGSPDLEQVVVDDVLLGMSLETEQKLIQHTANQRALAVAKKLTQLIDDAYQSVSGQMEQISKDYAHRLELLNRSRKADLSMFVRQEKLERLQCFDVAAKDLLEKAEQSVYANATAARTTVIGNLDNKNSTDELKRYINSSLGSDCKKQAENLMSQTDFYYGQIQTVFKDEMKIFHNSFQQIYKSLDIIPLDLSHTKYDFPQKTAIETADIESTANYIAGALTIENVEFLGKTAAGAAIGTVLFPGVGTIIGGAIGLVIGGNSVNKSEAVARQGCKDKLNPQLVSYYNSISEKVLSAIDQYIRTMRNCLSDGIDEYLKRYRSEVDRQIAVENNRRSAINKQIGDLKTDMTGIQNHKKQLDSVMMQLNNFGRKE